MAQTTIPNALLKQAMKEAFIETITKQWDLFADLMVEALEDFAMIEGI